jgi:hypothetical protein
MSRSFSEQEEHKIKPHILRGLPKHTAVRIHCERRHRRKLIAPIEPNREVCSWLRG